MDILNCGDDSGAIAGGTAVGTPEQLGKYLQKAMLQIKANHVGADGRGVDYSSLASSSAFLDYVNVARKLVNCDLTSLSENARMAFFISIL
jgi:hypothetical protein